MNEIITVENDKKNCLRTESELIKKEEKEKIFNLLSNKLEEEINAAGLALPQLGLNKRAIGIKLVDENDPESYKIVILFNPKIFQKSKKTFIQKESCLSVPEKEDDIERFLSISVKHDHGIMNFRNFYSAVVQHEIDHLDGILFIDKAKNIKEKN